MSTEAATEKVCDHEEWIGEPYGFVPINWRGVVCQVRITAGEMLILNAVRKLKIESEH